MYGDMLSCSGVACVRCRIIVQASEIIIGREVVEIHPSLLSAACSPGGRGSDY